jgi:hypothetical protein
MLLTPSAEMDPAPSALPVTILTGFLGAGKTTLLNHILSNQQGVKTAVLVNEFGEIGIDNDLVVATGDEMVELSNGCICCSINGELLDAVYRILDRPDPVDYLVAVICGMPPGWIRSSPWWMRRTSGLRSSRGRWRGRRLCTAT